MVMHRLALLILCGFLSPFTAFSDDNKILRKSADKPNVIIVYLDDAGYGDFGFTGNKNVKTPELDRLSEQSLCLTNFHSGSPACTASRYAIMTGKSPARSGLGTWVLYPTDRKYLDPREQTIAETMKMAGYATGIIGKWHLGVPNKANGFDPRSLPMAHGFDTYFGIPYSNDMTPAPLIRQPGNSESYPTASVVENPVRQDNLTQTYFKEARDFIRKNKNHPFFLYLATSMPHVPLHAGPGFRGKSATGRTYDDVIQEIDNQMGSLVRTVDAEGLGENTLIIFSSDNGPWLMKGDDGGCALPYRDGKGSTFEGGVRVPCLLRWTSVISPAKKDNLTSVLDLHPTLAAITGQVISPFGTLDGRSIAFLLNEKFGTKPANDDNYILVLTGKTYNVPMTAQCGQWKIHFDTFSQLWGQNRIRNHNSPPVKASLDKPLLYDLNKDVSETTNVAEEHPEVVAKLKKHFLEFKASIKKENEARRKSTL